MVLVVSACGSTVQWSEAVPEGAAGAGELGRSSPEESGAGLGEPGRKAQDGATALKPGGSTATAPGDEAARKPGGSATPSVAGAAPPSGARGRGFTAKEVYIGYGTMKDADTLAIGSEKNFGNPEARARAIVEDINARGGLAGRKIVLVFHDVKLNQAIQDPNAVAQAACARWTEDRPVFAVVNLVVPINNDTLFSCLAKRQTPIVINGVTMHSAPQMARYAGYLYGPSLPVIERLVPVWMKRLGALGYFKKWDTSAGQPGVAEVKVGLLHSNDFQGGGGRFGPTVERSLARQGRTVAAKFEYRASSVSSDMNQAVLRFRRAGVTHVVGDANLFFFAEAAGSQNYRPRYAFSSFSYPTLFLAATPDGQMNGALGVGYMPLGDVLNAQDPGDVSSAQARCRAVAKKAGQDTSNRQAMAASVLGCDAFNFLVAAVKGGGLSPAGMQRGTRAIGAMPPAATFGISFDGGRPDGASAVRDLGYRGDCRCFAYLSRTNHGM